jgi:DNA-binding IclR family transcriptional regulator
MRADQTLGEPRAIGAGHHDRPGEVLAAVGIGEQQRPDRDAFAEQHGEELRVAAPERAVEVIAVVVGVRDGGQREDQRKRELHGCRQR